MVHLPSLHCGSLWPEDFKLFDYNTFLTKEVRTEDYSYEHCIMYVYVPPTIKSPWWFYWWLMLCGVRRFGKVNNSSLSLWEHGWAMWWLLCHFVGGCSTSSSSRFINLATAAICLNIHEVWNDAELGTWHTFS